MALIGSQKFDQDEVRVVQGGAGDTTIQAGEATWAVKPDGTGREAVYAIVVRQFTLQGYEVASEDGATTRLHRRAPGAYETPGPTVDYFLERTDMGWANADGHDESYDAGLAAAAAVEAFGGGAPHPIGTAAGPARAGGFPAQPAAEALMAQALALVRAGHKIEAIKVLRQADPRLSLVQAKDVVEAMAVQGMAAAAPLAAAGAAGLAHGAALADAGLPPHIADEVAALLRAGQKIPAIKMVRDADPRLGLKEAKDLVDEAQRRLGIPNAGGGCATALVFAAGSLAALAVGVARYL